MATQTNLYAALAGYVGRPEATGRVGVFRRDAAGGEWQHVLPGLEAFTVVVHPRNPDVVFAGTGAGFWGIYSLPVGGPAQGVTPVNDVCRTAGPKGPLVIGSDAPLPGDPFTGAPPNKPIAAWDFIQTDGQRAYFRGFDDNLPCCSSLGGGSGAPASRSARSFWPPPMSIPICSGN